MYLEITYEEAVIRYPTQVSEVMTKLRAGRSREKGRDASELRWGFDWGVRIGMRSGEEFMQAILGLAKGERPKPKDLTEDQAVGQYQRDSSVVLHGAVGRWYGTSESLIDKLPAEIEEMVRTNYRLEAAEKERSEALTPKQRDAEVVELLKQLEGPGFMTLQIPGKKRRR
jgi:hypothetical protein